MQLIFNHSKTIKKVIENEFKRLDIPFDQVSSSEIRPSEPLCKMKYQAIKKSLSEFGIQIVEDPKEKLIARIKEVIHQLVYSFEKLPSIKTSIYLSQKLGYSYGYLSSIFSEGTSISIENYLILKKIELVKLILLQNNSTVTEVAFRLNYSSVSHLCNQFKKKTGLTPSEFQYIMSKRVINFA